MEAAASKHRVHTTPYALVASPLTPATAHAHPGRRALLCFCLALLLIAPPFSLNATHSHLTRSLFAIKRLTTLRPRGATCHTCCSMDRRAPARRRVSCRFSVPSTARGWRRYVVVFAVCAVYGKQIHGTRRLSRCPLPGRAARPFLGKAEGRCARGGVRGGQREMTRTQPSYPSFFRSLTHVGRMWSKSFTDNLDGV